MADASKAKNHVFIGRWLNLVFYSYIENCRSAGAEPFTYELTNGRPDARVHKAFVDAAYATRDRLVSETGTLVTVSALMANISYQLFTRAPLLNSQQDHALRKAWMAFATISFICSISQLFLGATIGLLSVGRTPRTFLHFLLDGEHLVESSLSCFLTALLTLLAGMLMYIFASISNFYSPAGQLGLVCSLAATCCLLICTAMVLAGTQWRYEYAGRTVPKVALRCLGPFLGYDYDWFRAFDPTQSAPEQSAPEQSALMKADYLTLKATERLTWSALSCYIEEHASACDSLPSPTFASYLYILLLLGLGPLSLPTSACIKWLFKKRIDPQREEECKETLTVDQALRRPPRNSPSPASAPAPASAPTNGTASGPAADVVNMRV